jgi:hypothetical protein
MLQRFGSIVQIACRSRLYLTGTMSGVGDAPQIGNVPRCYGRKRRDRAMSAYPRLWTNCRGAQSDSQTRRLLYVPAMSALPVIATTRPQIDAGGDALGSVKGLQCVYTDLDAFPRRPVFFRS